MAKVSVIYRAPKGDSKVVEWGGYTFFDGRVTEVEDNDDSAHMLGKMANNRCFEVTGVKAGKAPEPKPRAPEPEVYPEETPDDDPESEPQAEPEDENEENDQEPEEKGPPFTDYVAVEEEAADAEPKSKSAAKPRTKSRAKSRSKHRAA